MNSIDLLIADRTVCLRGSLAAEWAGAVIASLSADPVTWEELQYALGRFVVADERTTDLGLHSISAPQPAARGGTVPVPDCVIDLPGRLLLTHWDQVRDPIPAGRVGSDKSEFLLLRYHLSSDWLISSDFAHWPRRAEQRRREGAARWTVDPRTSLYGSPLLTFLVQRSGALVSEPDSPAATPADGRGPVEVLPDEHWQAARKVFCDWLEQRPAELHDRSVRNVLEQEMEHLSSDLEDRESQWVRTGKSPLGLRETDTAYRCAGVGPHEAILYEEMVMFLLGAYTRRLADAADTRGELAGEVDWLRERRDEWLWRTDDEDLMGKSPREIIDQERRRIPLVVDDAHDVQHDDCPLCQMMISDEGRPVFWRLNCWDSALQPALDRDIDWEDQDDDECDDADNWEESLDDPRSLVDAPVRGQPGPPDPVAHEARGFPPMDSVWKRVCIVSQPGEVSAEVDLFTIAACTGELIEDLKQHQVERPLIDSLNRHVGNLASALRSSSPDLLAPVVARFCECLDEIEIFYEELADKVDDLQTRLVGLVQVVED